MQMFIAAIEDGEVGPCEIALAHHAEQAAGDAGSDG